MTVEKKTLFTNEEMYRLLDEIDKSDDSMIVPLTEKEVAELETSYQPHPIDEDRDRRQRKHLEKLRKEWIANSVELTSLIEQAKKLGMSRRDLVQRLRIRPDILLKLERRLIPEFPNQVCQELATVLQVDFRSIHRYLQQTPKDLEQMAASSRDKPTTSRTETWREAILKSKSMSESDKAYWLDAK